jgi:hypothetical protein
MIVFDLTCDKNHVFEAWFKDSATFDRQSKRKLVSCAVCGSTHVRKAPMAPRIATGGGEAPAEAAAPITATAGEGPRAMLATDPMAAKAAKLMAELKELRKQIEKNCEYVGPRFAESARKMHYGEAEKRNIYGEASEQEARELADEGVEFAPVPWLPRTDS